MLRSTVLVASSVFALYGFSAVAPANAAPAYALQLGSPVFCFGYDEDVNQCLLYLGDAQTCASLPPCPQSPFAPGVGLPNKFKIVGARKPGKCELVIASESDNWTASGKPPREEPMCRFEIPSR